MRENVKGKTIMASRRLVLAAMVAAALFPAAAFAQDASAKTFLDSIYKRYVGKNTKGIPLDSDAVIRRYFEPSLAALIIKDGKAAARRKDVPTLDGDAFIGAQDWEIKSVKIDVADAGPGKATGTVSFTNSGEAKKVVLDLTKVGNDWKIADINWGEDSLRKLYKK
jgi:Protein of unknown function (DUF3828)